MFRIFSFLALMLIFFWFIPISIRRQQDLRKNFAISIGFVEYAGSAGKGNGQGVRYRFYDNAGKLFIGHRHGIPTKGVHLVLIFLISVCLWKKL